MVKQTLFLPLVLCIVAWGAAGPAHGKANGFASDSCSGCHRGGTNFKPQVTADPAVIAPGGSTTLTLMIPGASAGFYFTSNTKGAFTEIAGEGIMKVSETSITHRSPKGGAGGMVTFKVKWTAPNNGPGGADFDLTAVSANGDGRSGGDAEGITRFNFSFGCEGVNVYLDQDGDGFGLTDLRGPQRQCELKAGWALKSGDCNDYDKNANPMGTEICNLYDDDCDGMINEGLDNVTVYRDMDNDGHGARNNAETKIGCGNGAGWSSLRDDCDDTDRMINPRIKEACNFKDDNCNNRVDEGVRPSCGVGWCRREASSCEMNAACTPNPPRAEICNFFDDDCDGVVDNNVTCPGANVCYKGACVTREDAMMMAANEPPPPPDAGVPDPGAGGSGGATSPGGSGGPSGAGSPSTPGAGGQAGSSTPAGSDEGSQPKFGCAIGGSSASAPLSAFLFAFGFVFIAGLAARWRRRATRPRL